MANIEEHSIFFGNWTLGRKRNWCWVL